MGAGPPAGGISNTHPQHTGAGALHHRWNIRPAPAPVESKICEYLHPRVELPGLEAAGLPLDAGAPGNNLYFLAIDLNIYSPFMFVSVIKCETLCLAPKGSDNTLVDKMRGKNVFSGWV